MPMAGYAEPWTTQPHRDGSITLMHYSHTVSTLEPWDAVRVVNALLASMGEDARADTLQRAMQGGPMDASGNRAWAPVRQKEGE